MLGRSEFALRQGFALRAKRLTCLPEARLVLTALRKPAEAGFLHYQKNAI
jgi:hypothetical protein